MLSGLNVNGGNELEGRPEMTSTEIKAIERKDLNAARVVRKLSVSAPSVCGDLVSHETMALINSHAKFLATEIFKPTLGLAVPEVIVSVEWDSKKRLGHFKVGRDGLGLMWRIVLNVRHLAAPRAQVIAVLCHEMMHAAQYKSGKPGKGNYHNAQFLSWCEKAGIPTNAKGHFLGITEDGEFAKYVARHKLEGAEKLIAKSDLPRPAPTKNKKWTCGCGVNVRCAVDLNATCDECGTRFELQEK
jgi:hypothetical protein